MYLYGASGHGRVIAEILEEKGIPVEGVYDDNPLQTSFYGYPFKGPYSSESRDGEFIISIGNNPTRFRLSRAMDVRWGIAVSLSSSFSSFSSLGEGSVVVRGASVNPGCRIGRHVILNTNCSVDHDCELEDFVHISPNASLCGGVRIGEGSHVGASACLIPGIQVGKWAVIGAGSVVIRDVPDFAVVVGNPGRIIRYQRPVENLPHELAKEK